MKKVYTPTDYNEKQMQRALLQFNRPENADKVRTALRKAGREDLIGYAPNCLVRPERAGGEYKGGESRGKGRKNAGADKKTPHRDSRGGTKDAKTGNKDTRRAPNTSSKAKKMGAKGTARPNNKRR